MMDLLPLERVRGRPTRFLEAEKAFGWHLCRRIEDGASAFGGSNLNDAPAQGFGYFSIVMNDDPSASQKKKRWDAWKEYVGSLNGPAHIRVVASGYKADFVEAILANENVVSVEFWRWPSGLDLAMLAGGKHLAGLWLGGVRSPCLSFVASMDNLRALEIRPTTASIDVAPLEGLALWELAVRGGGTKLLEILNAAAIRSMPELCHLNLFCTKNREGWVLGDGWVSNTLEYVVASDWFWREAYDGAIDDALTRLVGTGEHLGDQFREFAMRHKG